MEGRSKVDAKERKNGEKWKEWKDYSCCGIGGVRGGGKNVKRVLYRLDGCSLVKSWRVGRND